MKKLLVLSFVALFLGCKGGKEEEPLYNPQTGYWYLEVVSVDNGCDLDEFMESGESYVEIYEDHLVVDPGTDEEQEMTRDGNEFSSFEQEEIDFATQGYDCVITMSMGIEGQFTSDTTGEVEVSVSITDNGGTDCPAIEASMGLSLPCTSTAAGTITYEGPAE